MNNLLPILAMIVGALVVGAIVGAVAWRFSRRAATRAAEAHATGVVAELTLRVEELAADLLSALDRAESEGRRARVLGDPKVSIDLDEVLDRISKTTISLDGVDAVVVSVDDPLGGRIVSTAGMTPEQARTQIFSSSPDAKAHSMSITYHYVGGADGRLRSAHVLPLPGTAERLGYLTAYSRSRERNRDLAEDVGNDLEEVARRAGPAVENALRFREARRLAELDAAPPRRRQGPGDGRADARRRPALRHSLPRRRRRIRGRLARVGDRPGRSALSPDPGGGLGTADRPCREPQSLRRHSPS